MPLSPTTSPLSLRQLVAKQFANRPRLREVIAAAGFDALAARYPWTRKNHPQLQSLKGFSILPGPDEQAPAQPGKLVDTLLEHFLNGQPMALKPTARLSLAPPAIFRPQEAAPTIDIRMADLNTAFDDMLATLGEAFQQAQVSFWNSREADSDVTPLCWMQQVLKAALLGTLERQGLDSDQKALLYAVLAQTSPSANVQGLQISFNTQGSTVHQVLPDLLVTGKKGARDLVLWCKPSGTVRGFNGLAAFAAALREALCEHYAFDTMSWACTALTEDPFGYQARQLLNAILQQIDRVQLGATKQASDLEAVFSRLSDPSSTFPACFLLEQLTPAIRLPDWLENATVTDRFQYHMALLELSAEHMLAQGESSLDGIEDLQQFTVRRLREQMRDDHPADPPYNPDQVQITISQVVQTSSAGPARLEYLKTISLTEMAISRLPLGSDQVASAIQLADQQTLSSWMNLDYVNALIAAVDIGGHYPKFVHDQLQAGADTDKRRQRFAQEWRAALMLSALQAKIGGQLTEQTWQAIADFCRRKADSSAPLSLAPLAFNSVPGGPKANQVHGMFVIEVPATAAWVLYRPMATAQAVRQFDSRSQLMTAIRAEQGLQQDILTWLNDDARPIYANDGFTHPHLHAGLTELAHLLGPASGLAVGAIEQLRAPVTLAFTPWTGDPDLMMFQARADMLLLLASRQSVSNAEQRWALVVQFAWLAFNTATILLRGPAGLVAWLVAALLSIKDDLTALTQGSSEEKLLAGADILLNLAMLLAHGHVTAIPAPETETPIRPGPRRSPGATARQPPEQTTWQALAEQPRPAALNVSQWGHDQRVGNLPSEARAALDTLRAKVNLNGQPALASGRMRGLYKVDERYYAKLQGVFFEVEERWNGMRIIGPQVSESEWSQTWGAEPDGYYMADRERSNGPWLTRWNGEWMLDLHLPGGMPKTARALIDEKKEAFSKMLESRVANDKKLTSTDTFIDGYLERVKAYDQAHLAFEKSLDDYPGVALDNLPEHLQERRQALRTLRNEARANINVLALTYEKQAGLIREQAELYASMSDPKYARFDPKGAAVFGRGQWWEQLLTADLQQFRRLLDMNDYEALKRQSRRLVQLPFGQEQAQLYLDYSKNIDAALGIHRRVFNVSQRLDQNLNEALTDGQIQFSGKRKKLDTIINNRRYSTLITRGQILSDLVQLVVRRDQLTAENFESTLLAQQDLRSRHLHEALLSHDSLTAAHLKPEEQKEPLESALREYKLSLGNAEYLLSRNIPAVDNSRLNEYIGEINALISLTEHDLAAISAAADTQDALPEQQLTHKVRPARRKIIRTSRGRALVVEEAEEGSEAVQIDPLTEQTITRYQQQGDHWEAVPQRVPAPDYARLRRTGNDLLAQKAARIAHASRHLDGPNSLADLLDFYVQDMSEVAVQLRTGPEQGHSLASRLEQAIDEVKAEKQRLLTSAYLGTRHPDSRALRFLVQADEVEVRLSKRRKKLKANDYLDVYDIDRLQPRQKLWEAHFHYTSASAAARRFAKGHLKFPNAMSRDERLQRALAATERYDIYRGDLRLEQIEDLIPFPDN
ncbi:MAG: hypothetical protein P0Y58_04240 [Candidatus Pseudomonas phytovorans]|uniref:Uncharacterized protein n=1 Tax=Candidatus Pseudomonas phytovorans TaxID=3121377 RepID=A0AAJ5WKP9_9PSED|nr:DUF6543 domain-containing protein [Pseudomonas sp.]WEK31412.1 MAG: hypothetical protein P0Y58_04240 [Pseudomonas sp.]